MATVPLNELERTLLSAFAEQEPLLVSGIDRLHVTEREFTGVGSFTTFAPTAVAAAIPDGPIGFDGRIEIPGIPNGLGASITMEAGSVGFLEIVALGSDWDGSYDGFTVKRA